MAKQKYVVNKKVTPKKKKRFNWHIVGYYFKSLFNNEIAKEIGIKKWIISIGVMLFSIGLTVIPTGVAEGTRKGSSGVSNTNNDMITETIYDYATTEEAPDLKIVNHQLLKINDTSEQKVHEFKKGDQKVSIYYIDTRNELLNFDDQVKNILDNTKDNTGYVFFGTKYFSTTVYSNSLRSQALSAASGGYEHFENIDSLKTFLNRNVDSSAQINDQKSQVMINFYEFCDTAYLDIRPQNAGIQVGIIAGINGGITLIMTLVLFLMSRGKNNPNRLLKFYETMGIAFITSLTPALLALILGFIFSGAFQTVSMLYIMLYGFRCMWLAMKYLRPIQY